MRSKEAIATVLKADISEIKPYQVTQAKARVWCYGGRLYHATRPKCPSPFLGGDWALVSDWTGWHIWRRDS
jgi:hypothetical protein